ncbi:hypothetical protein T492DRAFT_1005001 [Pavlovales sp. CCMP2436]|nr:hypothetical protein T492DRAFT_1005001 [Pavlovales sp. CCMP2436]
MMSDDAGRRPIDLVARGLQSPAVSLTVSGVIVSWLVVNRFLLDEVANSQNDTDLLATVAFSVLVLRALSALDIDTRVAEPQQLIGTRVECELTGTGVERADEFLRWLGTTLLACTPTSSIVIYDRARQQTLLRSGVMGPDADVSPGPILEKCLTVDRARGTYLASLQNYPGRFEFKCLPPNTQCVLVQPYGDGRGVIILGANVAKVYTVKHLSWVQLVADRLAAELGRAP